MKDIFVGRQPIYDANLGVIGYELLFRSGQVNSAGQLDDVQATSQVIVNVFVGIGLEQVVGSKLAFINLSRGFLIRASNLPFSPDQVVFEILETVTPDEGLRNELGILSALGYQLALDDFEFSEEWLPVLRQVHYVKLDVLALPMSQLTNQVALLKPLGIKLVAEKIEDRAMFQQCRELGFDYFQGFFLSKPEIVTSRRLPPNQVAMLQLLAELQKPEVDVSDLEALISRDVALSYDLLKYINSAFFSLPRRVDSIRQAVVYLGNAQIKRYVSLLVLAGDKSKPAEIIVTAMTRGRMCELLAQKAGRDSPEIYFTVGLFSMLEVLMERPLPVILEPLPLAAETRDALLHGSGPYGEVLTGVLAYEHGDFAACRIDELTPEQITGAYLDAVQWADAALTELTRSEPPT